MIVWVGDYETRPPRKLVLQVLGMNNMEKIKMEIKKQEMFTNIELRLFMMNDHITPNQMNWNEATILKSENIIMSWKIYQNNSVIMAKLIKENVS